VRACLAVSPPGAAVSRCRRGQLVAVVAGTVPARRAAPPAGAPSGFVTAPMSCHPRPGTSSRGHRQTAELRPPTSMPLFPRTPMTPSTGRDDFRCAHDAAPSSSASHAPNASRPPSEHRHRPPLEHRCRPPAQTPGADAEPHHQTPASSPSCSTASCATRTDRARHLPPHCHTLPALLP
jgi:hypothetical protein